MNALNLDSSHAYVFEKPDPPSAGHSNPYSLQIRFHSSPDPLVSLRNVSITDIIEETACHNTSYHSNAVGAVYRPSGSAYDRWRVGEKRYETASVVFTAGESAAWRES